METENNLHVSQNKIIKLQKDLKAIVKERDDLNEIKESKELATEKYRIMKLKSMDLISKLFSIEAPKIFSLRYMEIDNNFINTLVNILKKYPSIEIIDLEGNFITDIGAKMLADIIITTDGSLNELNLSCNKITSEGA